MNWTVAAMLAAKAWKYRQVGIAAYQTYKGVKGKKRRKGNAKRR